jgi:hypothetical protein
MKMAKIGRNDTCPCGSGLKYKRCCLGKQQSVSSNLTEAQKIQISLQNEINAIQKLASKSKFKVRELGVFVLFSTDKGDAWLLEVTESDALQLAAEREIMTVDLEENPETIEIHWTHTFEIKNKQFIITDYKDKKVEAINNYPTHPISAAIKRIKKKFSPEQLEQVHIDEQPIT